MIDTTVVGTEYPHLDVEVQRGPLRAFALAVGETSPVYTDVNAAREAGHPDLPVPPTYLFGLGLGRGRDDFRWLSDLGIDLRAVLHGEQSFRYATLAHAGDTLRLMRRIVDAYQKRDGRLQFLVRETSVTRPDGTPVATMRETVVVRELTS
jgi:acyl dehydratase